MNNIIDRSKARTQKWGWGILLAVSALLVLNGLGWFFMAGSLSTFEQDTGIPLSEFKEAYPTVAEGIARQGQQVAIWFAAYGLLVLGVAWEGYRHGSRWAWNLSWFLFAVLVAIGINALTGGELAFGSGMLIGAAIALIGQLLARS